MGNHKLRLSNIIPNVWFYKLKEMTTNSGSNSNNNKFIRNHHLATKATNLDPSTPPPSLPRKSYHFTRRNLNSKSSRKTRPTTKSSSSSSVSTACSCATATAHSVQSKPASTTSSSSLDNLSLPPDQLHCFDRMVACSSTSCNGSSNSPVPDDLANDNDHNDVVIGVATMSLTPIRTEHKKFSDLVREIGAAEEEQTDIDDQPNKQRKSPAVRRISTSSGSPRRVRIRINSPKLSKRVESTAAGRKSVKSSESVAVVKSSADPERDFRESMVEMIVENEIRAAKDLEDLLACYLSLNSVEYHHLIIQVFKQIWFGLNQIHYS